ncbi:MAG: flagellar brake protein [Betaproteobacteria bacterium]|nr:flagellar brake protein [Betaproteobacteria bacterium]
MNIFMNADGDPDIDHYLLRARIDILPVLNALVERQIPIRVKFSRVAEPLDTRLLSVRPEYEELIFDATGVRDLDALEGTESIEAGAKIDVIRIFFNTGYAEGAIFRGQRVFRARVPETIARVQRRGSVRYQVPALNPPVVSLRLPSKNNRELRLRLMDISLGGAALVLEDRALAFEPGATLRKCRLDLPGCGVVETDLAVQYVDRMDRKSGWRRMGCRFADLPVFALTHVRRYVTTLERAQIEASHRG